MIHTGASSHVTGSRALVLGLAERKKATGNTVHYIHVSSEVFGTQDSSNMVFKTGGISNLGDHPISGIYLEPRILSDKEDIYTYLKDRESKKVYQQRTTDVVVIETGLEGNVPTTILVSPTIYGVGTGLFNRTSVQAPTILRAGIKDGQVSVIGDGNGVWDYVHVADLTDLYEIIIKRVLNGEEVPVGKSGIVFNGSGRYQWKDLSASIADALFDAGAIKTKELKSITLEEAAQWVGGSTLIAELAYASK